MKPSRGTRIGRIFTDGRQIDEALRSAVRGAIRTHQKRNVPVVIWRDGHVALIPARELTTPSTVPSKRKAVPRRGR